MPKNDNNGESNLSESEIILKVVDRARKEIDWVRSYYKWLLSGIVIVIAAGLFFSYKSIQDFKADIRNDGKRIQQQIKKESTLLIDTVKTNLEYEANSIRASVLKQIDDEFKKEKITKLVEAQSKKRIDSIADKLIEKQISEKIAPEIAKSREIEKELHKLAEETKIQSKFILTVLAAQNDDRNAFEQLKQWARDKSYLLNNLSIGAEREIIFDYSGLERAFENIPWNIGFNQQNMSFIEIEEDWSEVTNRYARYYVEFVWEHKNVDKEQKLKFLYNVLSDSKNSLHALNWSARTLAKELNAKYNPPFEFSDIKKKWDEREKAKTALEKESNATTK